MINTDTYKEKLREEKARLEGELREVATKKLNLEGEEWNAVPADREEAVEMRDEVADRFEDLTERQSMERSLEDRLKKIAEAVLRIEDGTYGKCRVCGQDIEEEKLAADTATTTCKTHVGDE